MTADEQRWDDDGGAQPYTPYQALARALVREAREMRPEMTPQNALRTLERVIPAAERTGSVQQALDLLWTLVLTGQE